MTSPQVETKNEDFDTNVDIKIPWDTKLALFFGAVFAILIFLINLFNVIQTIPLSIIMFSQMFLFLAGYVHWKALKEYKIIKFDKVLFKQKYYLMVFSLIIYLIGALLYIFLFNSDSNIRLTYLTVIPILLATANNFNVFFESSNTNEKDLKDESFGKASDGFYESILQYRKMFRLPLIFGIIGSFLITLLPWYSTTINKFELINYYNCPTCVNNQNVSQFLSPLTTFWGIFNVGISRFAVYFTIFLIVISGIIVYLSLNYIKSHQSRYLLLIGMATSILGSFITIAGILTLLYYLTEKLTYSYPHVLYFSLEIGFIVGFILTLFATSITMNLYKIVSEKYHLFYSN